MKKVLTIGCVLALFLLIVWITTDESNYVVIPGWHTTEFLFGFEAIFATVFHVLCLIQIALLVLSRFSGLDNWYSISRMDKLNWLILSFGAIISVSILYVQLIEPALSGLFEASIAFYFRVFGKMAVWFMILQFLPMASQFFWFKSTRQSPGWTAFVCVICLSPSAIEFVLARL